MRVPLRVLEEFYKGPFSPKGPKDPIIRYAALG